MDPLDPLTEIINSGQGFTTAIVLERIFWAMIGISFLGSISTSFKNHMASQNLSIKKSIFNYFKSIKNKNEDSSPFTGDEK